MHVNHDNYGVIYYFFVFLWFSTICFKNQMQHKNALITQKITAFIEFEFQAIFQLR